MISIPHRLFVDVLREKPGTQEILLSNLENGSRDGGFALTLGISGSSLEPVLRRAVRPSNFHSLLLQFSLRSLDLKSKKQKQHCKKAHLVVLPRKLE